MAESPRHPEHHDGRTCCGHLLLSIGHLNGCGSVSRAAAGSLAPPAVQSTTASPAMDRRYWWCTAGMFSARVLSSIQAVITCGGTPTEIAEVPRMMLRPLKMDIRTQGLASRGKTHLASRFPMSIITTHDKQNPSSTPSPTKRQSDIRSGHVAGTP